MASSEGEEWKAKGNAHFTKGKYQEAIPCYTKAIESTTDASQLAIYFSNRSAAYFQLKQFNNALEDAIKSRTHDSKFLKAYTRESSILTSMGRQREALHAILASKKVPGASDDTTIKEAIEKCWHSYITQYYRLLTRSMNVDVRWINETMGRGVFNTKSGTTEENIVIFTEKPLVSRIRPGSKLACGHCMRTKMTTEDLKPHYESQFPFMYPNLENGEHKFFECESCGEKYCSEVCRGTAFQRYHNLLCAKAPFWSAAHAADPIPHPIEMITSMCLEGQPAFINPLLIARIFSSIVNHIASEKATSNAVQEALEPYKLFSPSERAAEHVANVTVTCFRAIYHCKYQGHTDLLATLDSVITQELYHELHGIITRNAHHLQPLSDFHLHLESMSPFNQSLLASHYQDDITPMELVQSDWMKNLCVEGTGLFEVTNSMNHSCEPNAMVVHCHADNTISVVSKVPVSHGTELTISYIDETLPRSERQAKLKEFYGFTCECSKCSSEVEA